MASISKQALFEEYEFKIPWWRGGEPFLTLALKYHSWKIIGGEVASTSKQTLFDDTSFKKLCMKNYWSRGGEPALIQALKYHPWKIIGGEVASIFKQSLFESYESKSQWWRGGEPVLIQALTNQSWKSLVARWRAYPNRIFLMNMNSKFPGGEKASNFWH